MQMLNSEERTSSFPDQMQNQRELDLRKPPEVKATHQFTLGFTVWVTLTQNERLPQAHIGFKLYLSSPVT